VASDPEGSSCKQIQLKKGAVAMQGVLMLAALALSMFTLTDCGLLSIQTKAILKVKI
jgi:hypothetical protein